jgi:Pilin (bacterial filament)
MKQFAITFAAVLCAAALALFGYDYFIVKPRAAAQADAIQVDLTKAQTQAQGIADNLDAAVAKTMNNVSESMDAQTGEMQQRALAADALARASVFKVALTEYFMSNNQWPKNHADSGMAKPETFAGGAVASISVEEKGMVVILLNDKIQAGAKIKLIPEANEQSYTINWHCTTEGSDTLKRQLTVCEK